MTATSAHRLLAHRLLVDSDEPIPALDPAVTRHVSLVVCAHATSPADAVDLLGVIGLPGGRVDPGRGGLLPCGHPASAARRISTQRGTRCGMCAALHRASQKSGGR